MPTDPPTTAAIIARATKLPSPVNGVLVTSTPQANSVAWALWVAREHKFSTDSTLVLVALAQHAAAALFNGDGYSYTTAKQVADLLDIPAHRVCRLLEPRYDLWPYVEERTEPNGVVLGWRIPEAALNGNWLDRAARRAHYGRTREEVVESPDTT